jgi:ubiquitin carboxyl-terminal hydrolase 5/13
VLAAGWVPKKLDVFVDVPDEIDISEMRSTGMQPDEELLPETPEGVPEQAGPAADEAIVSQLTDIGFPRVRCEKAAIQTLNTGVEEAMNWLLEHMDDPDIDDPIVASESTEASSAAPVNETDVETLVSFGFQAEMARKALRATGGNVERAAEWIFNNPEDTVAMELDGGTGTHEAQPEVHLPDGSGKYQLLAFVSHMGTSTQSGHYVAHVRKDGRWVIFNDCKVALSGDPPKDMGYLYFFQRVQS